MLQHLQLQEVEFQGDLNACAAVTEGTLVHDAGKVLHRQEALQLQLVFLQPPVHDHRFLYCHSVAPPTGIARPAPPPQQHQLGKILTPLFTGTRCVKFG